MSADVAVLWLDGGEARDDATRALREWARAHDVRLVALADGGAELAIDLSIAPRAEKELEQAREAIATLDGDTAERALARAERLLREHPELPNAAWLRAEVARTWSARWLRIEPRNEERARIAWEEAQALDGGRVAGVGETRFLPRAPVQATFAIASPSGRHLTVRLDGIILAPAESHGQTAVYTASVAPAEHQLTISSGDLAVFATWVALAGTAPAPTRIALPETNACTRGGLASVRRVDGRVVAPGVDCPSWVAAVPGPRPGSILVARCEGEACGALLEWRVERYDAPGPAPARRTGEGWPGWATWTLVGVGAATALSVALIATGVFETRAPVPRFVVGGARQE